MLRHFIEVLPGGSYALLAFDLLTSRIGLAVICGLGAFVAGYQMADDSNDKRNLQSQIATLKADLDIAHKAELKARNQATELELAADENKERVHALEEDLAKRAPERRSCALSESDSRRLRSIK